MEKTLIAEKYDALAESLDKAEANYNSSTRDTMFSEYPEMLDTKQLCQALGCSEKYVYKLIREGKLPKLNWWYISPLTTVCAEAKSSV